ncbi:hypothetical protein WK57_30495 [Burkholderia ubonensis]|uniref:Uncharacterized protein n=2 Tax=Burkholderia ubonensis TaxID=101571 RepID=A0AA40R517_9BURK|nr:hypothetical protein WK57_30495 [Burkholderia ubonensis]
MTTVITLPDRAKKALHTADHEPALVALVQKTADITEIKNADGRAQCHTAYMTLKTRRTDIRKAGKDARDDATKFSKAIITEEDRLVALIEPEEQRLQKLRDEWDAKVEAERREKAQAEQRRKDGIRAKIDELRAVPLNLWEAPAEKIAAALEDLEAFEVTADVFAEFIDAAHSARAEVVAKLTAMHAAAVERAVEAARVAAEREELARQRAEQEERERQAAAARAEQERVDRERREAEEAQARAEREAEQRKIDEQKAEIARQQAALEAERKRIADEAAARQRAEEEAAAARRRAEEEAAAAERRKQEEAAAAVRRAQAQLEEAERRAREAADTAVRNAAPAMLEALEMFVDGVQRDDKEAVSIAFGKARKAVALARPAQAQRELQPAAA